MTFLLRIEAVNFAPVFEDTSQISVIRGAGLIMREAPRALADFLGIRGKDLDMQPLLGASIGVFKLEEDRLREAEYFLCSTEPYCYFTFVVAQVEMTENSLDDLAKLETQCRLKQLQQPSLAPPSPAEGSRVCPIDRWQPASVDITIATKKQHVSASVAARFNFGKDKKQSFHLDHAGLKREQFPHGFTHDLDELSVDTREEQEFLSGKMAVIALDGNAFGKLREHALSGAEPLDALNKFWTNYDINLRSFHRDWLAWAAEDAGYWGSGSSDQNKNLRMEFLTWGGDELVLVVPAWRGIETLHFFLRHTDTWKTPEGEKLNLTFSAGLVFCQHKAPIYRMRDLADKLLYRAKGRMKEADEGEMRHAWDYIVLESADYAMEELDTYFEHTYGTNAACSIDRRTPFAGPWKPEYFAALWKALEAFPRRELYLISDGAVAGDLQARLDRANKVSNGAADKLMEAAKALFQTPHGKPMDDAWIWLHLRELKDYLCPWMTMPTSVEVAP